MRVPRMIRPLAALGAALLISSSPGLAQTPTPPHQRWAQDVSDIRPDPGVIFGTLPNGMRYAIRKNTAPPGQVALRLIIDAGTMHEPAGQAGIAHFLEHMAFRGSTRMADGEVRLALERIGLRFGGDINAFTAGAATTYSFNLPRNDAAYIDTGLMLLREVGSELKIDPAALDAERGVVLAEIRARGGPQTELAQAVIRWQLGDHPLARNAAGDPKVVEAANAAQLRAFYDAYYRPERATLIVAGDINPDVIEPRVRRLFGDWRGRGAPGADPAPLTAPPATAPVTVLTIPGLSGDGFQALWFHPYEAPDLTKAGEMRRFVETVGEFAVRMRMRRMVEPGDQPFDSTDALASADIPHVERADIIQAFRTRDLAATLDFHERARRQLAVFGLTQDELTETLALLRANQESLINATGSTTQIAAQLAGGAESVVTTPADQRAFFEQAAATVTLTQVNASLRARMSGDPVMLYYGPSAPAGGEAAVGASLARARAAPVAAYAPPPVKPWTYTSFGTPGRIADRRGDGGLGVTMIRFENGVRLTVKSTSFVEGEVRIKVRFGQGQLGMPRDALGPSDLGYFMFTSGGLRGYSDNELSRTFNGKRVALSSDQAEDAYELTSGAGMTITPSDQLDLQLQRMTAAFTAPAYRPDRLPNSLASVAESERAAAFSPAAVFERLAPALLHSGDIRWVQTSADMLAGWKPGEAVAYIRPIVETAPIEVIIVGDVPVQRAIDAVARTFGALPPRAETPEPAGLRDVRFPAPTPSPVEFRHKGPADQALVAIAWPGTDAFADTRQTAAANLLAIVLTNRLIDEIRIRQAKTYTPAATEQFSTTLPGYGLILARATVRPEDVAAVMATIDQVAADLAARPISNDEFYRAQTPRLETLRRSRLSNSYWLRNLAGVQTDPRLAGQMIRAIDESQRLTPADIQAAARRWLVRDRSWRAVVTPEGATAP